jgi:hypothetical protein
VVNIATAPLPQNKGGKTVRKFIVWLTGKAAKITQSWREADRTQREQAQRTQAEHQQAMRQSDYRNRYRELSVEVNEVTMRHQENLNIEPRQNPRDLWISNLRRVRRNNVFSYQLLRRRTNEPDREGFVLCADVARRLHEGLNRNYTPFTYEVRCFLSDHLPGQYLVEVTITGNKPLPCSYTGSISRVRFNEYYGVYGEPRRDVYIIYPDGRESRLTGGQALEILVDYAWMNTRVVDDNGLMYLDGYRTPTGARVRIQR